jgi:type II secretory pathway pseudopilin PulG
LLDSAGMKQIFSAARRQAGYSAIELMMTVGIMGVVGSMAVFQISTAQPAQKSEGAMRVIMAQLNTARELSITQRRLIEVKFISPNQVQLIRHEVPGPTLTTLTTIPFEGNVQYNKITGIPDTPDAFGMHSSIDFGTATNYCFSTDGTLTDCNGNPINGTIVLATSNLTNSSRSITILGATGRVRGYRWNGRSWVLV